MRRLVKLVSRELREVRALSWVLAALPLAAVVVVRWTMDALWQNEWAPQDARPRWHGMTVPLCAAMSSAAIACDLFGRERASGTIDQVLALPVRRATLWAAKAATWLALTAAFLALGAGVQVWQLAAADGSAVAIRWTEEAIRSAPVAMFLVGGTGAAVLLVSTLGLRGLASLLVGCALAGGWWLASAALLLRIAPETEPLLLSLSLAAAVAASFAAFTLGRAWLGHVARPLAVAAATLVAVIAAPVYAAVHEAITVTPENGALQGVLVRPDGRYAVGTWMRGQRQGIHVIDMATGRTREAGGTTTWLAGDGRPLPYGNSSPAAWDSAGRFSVFRAADGRIMRALIDPADLSVTDVGPHERDSAQRRAEWDAWWKRPRWAAGRQVRRTTDDDPRPWECTVRLMHGDKAAGPRIDVRSWQEVRVMWDGLLVWQPERGVLMSRRLTDAAPEDASRDVVLATADPRHGSQPPHFTVNGATPEGSREDARLLVCADGRWTLASPAALPPIPLPESAVGPSVAIAYPAGASGPDGRAAALLYVDMHVGSTSVPRVLWDPRNGKTLAIRASCPQLTLLADGSLVAASHMAGIEHIAADFSSSHVVWSAGR